MSFSQALAQVGQIIEWEQQLSGRAMPAAPAATGTSASQPQAPAASTALPGSPPRAPGSFADALSSAQADLAPAAANEAPLGAAGSVTVPAVLGPTGGVTVPAVLGPAGGEAVSARDPRIEAMLEKATALLGKPYVWGGGHGSWAPASGYDCSGFVSAVLHAGGYLSRPQDTVTLPAANGIAPGPGNYVTIYDRDGAGQAGHVIIEIDGRFFESGGEHGSWGGGGGVEAIAAPTRAYLSSFDVILHPAGL